MMEIKKIHTPLTDDICRSLKIGDMVLLSGEVYTARDEAHRRLVETLLKGDRLPIDLKGSILFYAAPTPAKSGHAIGSIGPTTSYRMDRCTPKLIEIGLRGMIGKGKRSPVVIEAIKKFKAVYFGTLGGVAALTARCIKEASVVAYDDLGPEAIMKLTIEDLPVVVLNDAMGKDLYEEAFIKRHQR
jgi:fumarate hydratase subunit beta